MTTWLVSHQAGPTTCHDTEPQAAAEADRLARRLPLLTPVTYWRADIDAHDFGICYPPTCHRHAAEAINNEIGDRA